jgi:CRP-like cAMP-binding protein
MIPRIAASASRRGNMLLGTLPAAKGRGLISRCEPVDLAFGEVLCEAGDLLRHVYFPTASFISLIACVDDGARLEVGLIGAEGMFGTSLLLGVNVGSLLAIVQGAGPALRMSAAQFSLELKCDPALAKTLNTYLCVTLNQLSQMSACTRYHTVEARLARWLLMTRDRARANEFRITQEYLAYMLGVRRAGITHAAGSLQERQLIHYSRGKIRVLNARGLGAASCGCYAVAQQIYARLMV